MRANLRRHDLNMNARAHMERAPNHVREAYIATNEIGKARTVKRLVEDCEKIEQLLEKVTRGQAHDAGAPFS